MKAVFTMGIRIWSFIITAFLLVMILVLIIPVMPPFRGYVHVRSVLTGSMEPVIPVGSLVINRYTTDRDIRVGDIVTFRSAASVKPVYITHRIIEIHTGDALARFVTKGDRNAGPESDTISQANLEGKVVLVVPYLGYVVDLVKMPIVFLLVFFLPLSVFIFRQLHDAAVLWKRLPDTSRLADGTIRNSEIPVAVVLLLILQSMAPSKVYASFGSSPVRIRSITLSSAPDFKCRNKDGEDDKDDQGDDEDDTHKNEGERSGDDRKDGKTEENNGKHLGRICRGNADDGENVDDHDEDADNRDDSRIPHGEFVLSPDRKHMMFRIRHLSDKTHISYEFVYDDNGKDDGVRGDAELTGEDMYSRDIALGTCSAEDCVYRGHAGRFRLHAKLDGNTGDSVELSVYME